MSDQDTTLNELLAQEERNLMERLEAVRKLLGKSPLWETEGPVVRFSNRPSATRQTRQKARGIPRGSQTWEDYIISILRILGGRAKSMDVVQYAWEANPQLSQKKVREAVRGKMSKMAIAGRIGAIKSDVKSEGYTYVIVQEHTKNDPKADEHGASNTRDLGMP